jgi:peptidoglycan/xylan/chitin deacetylase (PgdA/CDA1 family)
MPLGPKTVLFTFDYELFLGKRSGSVKECLIEPTSKLLHLLDQYEFKGIFFIDTIFLCRLKETGEEHPNAALDYEAIRQQLRLLIERGHHIFPHIHAHWLDGEYLPEKNEWTLENTRFYHFASLPTDEQMRLFDDSISILCNIGGGSRPGFKLDAYRAGGWSIQPFKFFDTQFRRHGIIHDFSVIPGKCLFSDAHGFDFRNAPVNKPVYRFKDDVCEENGEGPYTEWTISTLPMTGIQKWIDFRIGGMLHRLRITKGNKGSTVISHIRGEGDAFNGGKTTRYIASFEGLNQYRIWRYVRLIRNSNYFHFISHPKLLNDFELRMTESLFRKLKKIRRLETDFRKAFMA